MGYDIYTSQPDPVLAERFARKYGYNYLFEHDKGLTVDELYTRTQPVEETFKYVGEPTVYFRSNIWGMSEIRTYFVDLFNTIPEDQRNIVGEKYLAFVDAISWNEGRHVKTQDILTILQLIQYYGQDIGQTPLVEEFIEYMEIASVLDGFLVW